MTITLAASIAAVLLVVGGVAGLALSIGPRTDEGGPVFDDRLTPGRIVAAVISVAAVLAGAVLFGTWSL